MITADFSYAALRAGRTRQGRMRVLPACVLLVSGVGAMSGCARGVAVTTVAPNGAWTRKITFHGVKPDKNGGEMGQKIEDAVVLPTGAEWKITRHDENDESIVTLERTLPPGATLTGDITVKGGKKGAGVVAVNTVRVQQTAPGVFQYTETLHWKGKPSEGLMLAKDAAVMVKKALPAPLATDANARDIANQMARVLWRELFGPGDPLLAEISALMTQPEIMERKTLRRTRGDMDKILKDKFGAQMTEEQRLAFMRRVVSESLGTVAMKGKSNAPGAAPKNDKADNTQSDAEDSGIALILSVKMPGRITQTNGERDELNGDVYWSLFPQAAALGDVTLSATCDTNPPANK